MPYFLKPKQLSIATFETEPPENIHMVHNVLYTSVCEVLAKLNRKELMFYGNNTGKTVHRYIPTN